MKQKTKRVLRYLAVTYLILLAASHIKRWSVPEAANPDPEQKTELVSGFSPEEEGDITIAYFEEGPQQPDAPTVLLIHGSPVGSDVFVPLIDELAKNYHVLAPDLPGHGGSTPRVKNASFPADAHYLAEFIKKEGVGPFQIVAYSRGGGPALYLKKLLPSQVQSITFLSSIGVQEEELLGNYTLNHALHAAQYYFFRVLEETTPHFGYLDNAILDSSYAQSFSQSDQRPLRRMLSEYEGPMLIQHGESDTLVPVSAAQEHHRIVPQSQLHVYPSGHLILIEEPEKIAHHIHEFIVKVQAGVATIRETASPERIAAAAASADHQPSKPLSGGPLAFLVLILILSTFVSEDLTCVIAGILAASGTLGFWTATGACFAGILIGDLAIFLLGRYLGARATRVIPFKWVLNEQRLEFAASWFQKKGAIVIFTSRFIPGSRVPIYFAAGMVGASPLRFFFLFSLAALIWTPLVVYFSKMMGVPILRFIDEFEIYALPAMIALILGLFVVIKVLVPLCTHRGRRILLGRYRRFTRWEFWPRHIFYPPIVLYVLAKGIRHRSPTLFTACNPGITAGGFVFESKQSIFRLFQNPDRDLAPTIILPAELSVTECRERIAAFQQKLAAPFPIVCKPDYGERGNGVRIVKKEEDLDSVLGQMRGDRVIQSFVPGLEFGVFYARKPNEKQGQILSITRKTYTSVTGDGITPIGDLILNDPRAVCMAPFFLREHKNQLLHVPEPGEKVVLAQLGTHCRGSLFLDGSDLIGEPVLAAIERILEGNNGFYFGRFDIKCPNEEDFANGRNLTVLELNGVTSECTHIYDPGLSLANAYRTLFRQWSLAFEIATLNRERGFQPYPARLLLRMIRDSLLRGHPSQAYPPAGNAGKEIDSKSERLNKPV